MPMPEPAPVLASHSTAQKRSAKKKQRKQRLRKARTGVPPPLKFDIWDEKVVPRSALLTVPEVAAAVRRSAQTIRLWRSQPDHPLKFRTIDGRPMTTVGDVLRYLNTPQQVSRSRQK